MVSDQKSKRLAENVIDSEMLRNAHGDLQVRGLEWIIDICAVKCLEMFRLLNMMCCGLSQEACIWVLLKIHALLQSGYNLRKVNAWNFIHYWARTWHFRAPVIHRKEKLFISSWSQICFLGFLKTIPLSFGLPFRTFTVCLLFPRCPLCLIHVCFRLLLSINNLPQAVTHNSAWWRGT